MLFIDAHEYWNPYDKTTEVGRAAPHVNHDDDKPLNVQKFLQEHSSHSNCQAVAQSVGQPHLDYRINQRKPLAKYFIVHCSTQTVQHQLLRRRVLYLLKSPRVAEYTGQRYVKHFLKRVFSTPND